MYLRENQKDGSSARYEEVNGLRVLGSLVGNTIFCCDFLDKKMKEAAKDSTKITSCLSDLQTMTRLFSVCTVHKMTHLFDSDVLSSPIEDLPNRYYIWESPMSIEFDAMINDFLCSITNKPQLPDHTNIISTMSTSQGGLGLQHPRSNAIAAFMMTTKRCLQFSQDGVWLGYNNLRVVLNHPITCLYSNWSTTTLQTMTTFRRYMKDMRHQSAAMVMIKM